MGLEYDNKRRTVLKLFLRFDNIVKLYVNVDFVLQK